MMVQFTLPMLKKGAFAFYCSTIPRGAAAAEALLLTYIKSVDCRILFGSTSSRKVEAVSSSFRLDALPIRNLISQTFSIFGLIRTMRKRKTHSTKRWKTANKIAESNSLIALHCGHSDRQRIDWAKSQKVQAILEPISWWKPSDCLYRSVSQLGGLRECRKKIRNVALEQDFLFYSMIASWDNERWLCIASFYWLTAHYCLILTYWQSCYTLLCSLEQYKYCPIFNCSEIK